MESLTKPELLMLFSILEGELEARDLVIDALKVPRAVNITIHSLTMKLFLHNICLFNNKLSAPLGVEVAVFRQRIM